VLNINLDDALNITDNGVCKFYDFLDFSYAADYDGNFEQIVFTVGTRRCVIERHGDVISSGDILGTEIFNEEAFVGIDLKDYIKSYIKKWFKISLPEKDTEKLKNILRLFTE
jgi:hypothetical protein